MINLHIQKIYNKNKNFWFSSLEKHPERYVGSKKKVRNKFKWKTPKWLDLDGFAALRAKIYVYTCGEESKRKIMEVQK